ncbi:hypothetical protein Glove_57g89 [Diversispora epigaea]|uniref:TLDc domain-containing protein n=1 Tax=Diversispora epigaea TaxID=1348612 RepID=A0A397JM67_9GLOM|nr:hypothetical protein Glove_57g89 [Diversispora epigaea]
MVHEISGRSEQYNLESAEGGNKDGRLTGLGLQKMMRKHFYVVLHNRSSYFDKELENAATNENELSPWIDQKSTTYSLANIPYEFQLILLGSKDGFDPKKFWNMCNGQAGAIVVAKVAGTAEIFGGYNPLAWDNSKNDYIETNNSFIFSSKNGNIQNSILSRNTYGPLFGNFEFTIKSSVSDFTHEKCWCSSGSGNNYEKRIRTTSQDFSCSTTTTTKTIITNSLNYQAQHQQQQQQKFHSPITIIIKLIQKTPLSQASIPSVPSSTVSF